MEHLGTGRDRFLPLIHRDPMTMSDPLSLWPPNQLPRFLRQLAPPSLSFRLHPPRLQACCVMEYTHRIVPLPQMAVLGPSKRGGSAVEIARLPGTGKFPMREHTIVTTAIIFHMVAKPQHPLLRGRSPICLKFPGQSLRIRLSIPCWVLRVIMRRQDQKRQR